MRFRDAAAIAALVVGCGLLVLVFLRGGILDVLAIPAAALNWIGIGLGAERLDRKPGTFRRTGTLGGGHQAQPENEGDAPGPASPWRPRRPGSF